jgi:benzil reductase ((S)-benzoin forming)
MGDRLALVTGTTSGIGESIAHQLLDRGWRVFGVARRGATIRHERYEHLSVDLGDTPSLAHEIGPRLAALLGDAALTRVGLVNNAANVALLGPIADMDVGQLSGVFATNLAAPMWLMGQVLRRTPNATPIRIVNVSTAAAVRGIAGLGAYGSSKAALRMAGMVLAAEIEEQRSRSEDRDIAILSFEPGTVDTPMQEAARSSSRDTLPTVDMFKRFATEERLIPPAVPAKDIVAFLESDGEPLFTHRRHGVS